MKKESKGLTTIKSMWLLKNTDSVKLYHQTQLLLSIYRDVVWQTITLTEDNECKIYHNIISKTYLGSFKYT